MRDIRFDAFRNILGENIGQGVAELFGEADESIQLAGAIFLFLIVRSYGGLVFGI